MEIIKIRLILSVNHCSITCYISASYFTSYFTIFVTFFPCSFYFLDPLRSPLRWFERITKVIRFMCNLTILELHDAYCIDRMPIVGNNYFRYPKISFSPYPQNLKTKFSRVMRSEFVYVVFTRDPLTRLWKTQL